MAWQRDGVGRGQESVTLIAYDADGMAEAVGSFYEAVAGIDPLTPWQMPAAHSVSPATAAPGLLPELKTVWQVVLPDRVDALKATGGKVTALTHDNSLTVIDADGRIADRKAIAAAERQQAIEALRPDPQNASRDLPKDKLPADRVVKHLATRPPLTAVAFWGGTLMLFDKDASPVARQQMPQDITGLTWLGDRLVVGLADGRLVALARE